MNRRQTLALAASGAAAVLIETTRATTMVFARSGDQPHDAPRQPVDVADSIPAGEIIVSLADRRLYHVRTPGKAISYPIATPRDQSLWDGTQKVTARREWPSWIPTPQMRKENPRLPSFVPGRHKYNPMGARALYLGNTYYRIHGTDAPWLVGQNVSKGCIRMHNDDVIELYDNTPVGTRVTVIRSSLASHPTGTARDRTHGLQQRKART